MDPAIIVAVVALAGSLFTLYVQARSVQRAQRRDAESTLAKYREPLALAAYELQSRLFNIVERRFLAIYYHSQEDWKSEYAVTNTLYVLGQFFAWTEIVRREIQYLAFSEIPETKEYAEHQESVVRVFQSDDPQLQDAFMIWRGEQRAIGELMIGAGNGTPQCIGYATFRARLMTDENFARWFQRLKRDIDTIADQPTPRLRDLQRALMDLMKQLDPRGLRFSGELRRL